MSVVAPPRRTFNDLFCGAGGFSHGRLGWQRHAAQVDRSDWAGVVVGLLKNDAHDQLFSFLQKIQNDPEPSVPRTRTQQHHHLQSNPKASPVQVQDRMEMGARARLWHPLLSHVRVRVRRLLRRAQSPRRAV